MTGLSEDDDRLAILLRAIRTPEPRADFLAGARRRISRPWKHGTVGKSSPASLPPP
jgi:hypothetical protein